jgi:hypothetical protein
MVTEGERQSDTPHIVHGHFENINPRCTKVTLLPIISFLSTVLLFKTVPFHPVGSAVYHSLWYPEWVMLIACNI